MPFSVSFFASRHGTLLLAISRTVAPLPLFHVDMPPDAEARLQCLAGTDCWVQVKVPFLSPALLEGVSSVFPPDIGCGVVF